MSLPARNPTTLARCVAKAVIKFKVTTTASWPTSTGRSILDGAGWHSSPQVKVPNGIHLIFLPPYSPELQPAARLWPLTNQAIVNRDFKDLDELQNAQAEWVLKSITTPQSSPGLNLLQMVAAPRFLMYSSF